MLLAQGRAKDRSEAETVPTIKLEVDPTLPFHFTNSSANCAIECVDRGFVACPDPFKKEDKSISSCHDREEFSDGVPAGCTSQDNDLIHRYYGCPREAFCGPAVIHADNLRGLERWDIEFKDA